MIRCCTVANVTVLLLLVVGCAAPAARCAGTNPDMLPDEWRTHAERTNYAETGRYDEIVDFCRRLAAASPYAHYTTFGVSGEGRPLPLLILSGNRVFTPEAAAANAKLLVLLQNCVHPGESAGKDASLELARDIVITAVHKNLLDEVNLLVMPIFSPDGHERFGPYSRINQNGPREMGWRVTATNLNLNREYAKADAVEMQAWLRLWVRWRPDLLFDNHTTNGSDHQYDLLYGTTRGADVDANIAGWVELTLLPRILPELAADGHVVMEYGYPRERHDLSQGIALARAFSPRYSTGYAAICNRPAFLVEVHALKPYARRVRVTYNIMLHTLEELNRRPRALREAICAADERCTKSRGAGPDGGVVLRQARTDDSRPFTYKAVVQRVRHSDITGDDVIEYTNVPVDVETKLYNQARVEKTITPPAAYLVPPQWADVVHRLKLHGVEFFRLKQAEPLEVDTYRFENVEFASQPFEGRHRPSYETIADHQIRDFVAGTLVIPLNQPRAKVAVHLLEPEAPDSLIAWGFFNAIFEQKEYTESYVMEPIAQEMLAADPALREEFEQKLQTDEKFANNPRPAVLLLPPLAILGRGAERVSRGTADGRDGTGPPEDPGVTLKVGRYTCCGTGL